jgi:hypothetical protein
MGPDDGYKHDKSTVDFFICTGRNYDSRILLYFRTLAMDLRGSLQLKHHWLERLDGAPPRKSSGFVQPSLLKYDVWVSFLNNDTHPKNFGILERASLFQKYIYHGVG